MFAAICGLELLLKQHFVSWQLALHVHMSAKVIRFGIQTLITLAVG